MNVSAHRLIKPKKEQRVFFCGDVHGNFAQFNKQLTEIGFRIGDDLLILTGDIIDRGSQNKEMIEFVVSTPEVYSVLGNHEMMFLNAIHDELVRTVYMEPRMGGSWIAKYSQTQLEEMAFLIKSNLPIAITIDLSGIRIGVIHAASPTDWQDVISPKPEDTEYYLWSREQFENIKNDVIQKRISNIEAVVLGHVCSKLTTSGNQIWIDTMWSEGLLTIIESKEILEKLKDDGI